MVNLNQNIEIQLNSIKNLLKSWQELEKINVETKPYFKKDVYKRYLRLIDAIIVGERPKIIKEELYKNLKYQENRAQKYKDDRKAALALVNGGYKNLLYISK